MLLSSTNNTIRFVGVGLVSLISVCFAFRFWKYVRKNRLPATRDEARKIMQKGLEMNRFHSFSAQELAEMIRSGTATSFEITKAHIDHIKLVNPLLNAIVKDRFEDALREAVEADTLVQQYKDDKKALSNLPPLHGVPCTIKECFALTGMPNASGLVSRKDIISTADATVVKRVKDAGAIPMGVTNTSELCMWIESHNSLYGRTRNPYDLSRIVGGSSGGEGCIIGSGASPFGVGSDIGGSIRMPAFFNGVFGHKPSGGLIPGTGQYPVAGGDALRYLTTGPLCRKAEDLAFLSQIMMGPDGQDEGCEEFTDLVELHQKSNEVDISSLKVFWLDSIDSFQVSSLEPQMRECLDNAVNEMSKCCEIISVREASQLTRRLNDAVEIWSCMIHKGNPVTFVSLMGNGKPFSAAWELVKWIIKGKTQFTAPGLVLCLVEKLPALTPKRTQRKVRKGQSLQGELEELLGDNGVLLFPSHPKIAPRHSRPLLYPFNWIYTGIWNVLQAPATQVPMGLSKEGLPVGIQVIARNGNDHLTLAVAQHLEKSFEGWVPPN